MNYKYNNLILIFLIIILFNYLSRKFEYYTDNKSNITVIISNYSRPHNLEKTIPVLKKYKNIDEIIISHGNPKTYKEFEGCKNVKNYEKNDLYGCTQRWFAYENSKNEYIMLLDDDLLPDEKLVNDMFKNLKEDPINLYGPMSRKCTKKGYEFFGFDKHNIILTGLSMTSKKLISSYIQNFNNYKDHLEETHGNGEDLSFNHNLKKVYNKVGKVVKGNHKTLDFETDAYSLNPNHNSLRHKFCKKFYD